MRRAVAAVALALTGIAFGGVPTAHAVDATVRVFNRSYNPSSVRVPPGGTVHWVNTEAGQNAETHTVTADDGSFSQVLPPGATFDRAFNASAAYHCEIHKRMHGVVVVANSGPSSTNPGPTTSTTRHPTTLDTRSTTTITLPNDLSTDTSDTSDLTTSSNAPQLTIHQTTHRNGAAIAALLLAITAVLGTGGYALYRLYPRR